MNETQVKDFWQGHPCGEEFVAETSEFGNDYEKFFNEYDNFRYQLEDHIPGCLDAINLKDKSVLEIGLGQGADSEQIIKRGAKWSGLDLTAESIKRVSTRLKLRKLDYEDIKQGSALEIPYPDQYFDKIYSHGVLHHIPKIKIAEKEIHRILKDDGEVIIMLYAKWSLNYLLSIFILRRLGLLITYFLGIKMSGKYKQHLINAKEIGIFKYLKMENFIHANTDGPLNPYSKVYDLKKVKEGFPDFQVTKSYKKFMYAPPMDTKFLPFQSSLGWHLWVHLKKTSSP